VARLIVLILIALLPLRGWSAVDMSVKMAAAETVAMPADCPMMNMTAIAGSGNAGSDNSQADEKSHTGCQSCQLCMSLVAQDIPRISLPESAPMSLALSPITRYASAELACDSKPPIS
jgi:hypothetical protein